MTGTPFILLVEDSAEDLELAARALRKTQPALAIEVARDGVEALDFVFGEGSHAGRDVAHAPKAVFLDLKLPKVDGVEVLKRLKSDPRTRAIAVVMLTSSMEQRDVERCYALGVNSYIVKPVTFERYTTAVQQLGSYWMQLNLPHGGDGR
ncbi:MAG: two-component system response regulator [Labilithrix sp.]|nr:two-component system response regulator [Labilithrix sp.]